MLNDIKLGFELSLLAEPSEPSRLKGRLKLLGWQACLVGWTGWLFLGRSCFSWLGPLVVVVFLIFLLLAVLSGSWARQYLHCHHVDGCGASLVFFWCLPSVFYFFLWTLLYESPGGNQVDGLPPARHQDMLKLHFLLQCKIVADQFDCQSLRSR